MSLFDQLKEDFRQLDECKEYVEEEHAELKRRIALKEGKYTKKPNTPTRPSSELTSILEIMEDLNDRPIERKVGIPQLQDEIWQWFIQNPKEKQRFLDFRWETSCYETCPAYQEAHRRLTIAWNGLHASSSHEIIRPILALLENQDPWAMISSNLDIGIRCMQESMVTSNQVIYDGLKNIMSTIGCFIETQSKITSLLFK